MASTSSSATASPSTQGWTYDVFLSFRGPDTRKTFIDVLYESLECRGIRTFKDDNRLEKGDCISLSLPNAIRESKFFIPVFSKGYASSKWCLEELATVMECQKKEQIVVPIFYHVEPSDVRKQEGSFGNSFKESVERFEEEKVKRWKKALKKAGELKGHHLKNDYNEYEATCAKEVAVDLHARLNNASLAYEVNLVGLQSRINNIVNWLRFTSNDADADADARFCGICDMGGMGKTTIAMVVFNRFLHQFDGACFLNNVRQHNVIELQKTLLTKILKEKSGVEISNDLNGRAMIRKRLQEKKVLIVLDDVDNYLKQLDNLAGGRDWFGRGSRVIITTRDAAVFRSLGVNKKYIHSVHKLGEEEGLQLFRSYAIKLKANTGVEQFCRPVVRYCEGLPLALKVLGSSLSGLEATEWESILKDLKNTFNPEIHKILEISYDRLDSKNKKIFLYIVCFFRHEEEKHVKDLLESCNLLPALGLRVLIEKSLISVEEGKIEMHDLIQEMGWHIARRELAMNPRSRIWEFKEVDDVLRGNMDSTEHIECIVSPYTCGFMWEKDENISSAFKALKILIGKRSYNKEDNNFDLVVKNNYQLPSSLEFIHFPHYPFPSLPTSFHPDGRITKEINKITYLNLSSSKDLLEIPNFDMMPNLKRLYLSNCYNLKEIHASIGHLKRLVLLDLSYCRNLKELPCFVQVSFLQFLKLEHCSALQNFPEIKTSMGYVVELNLESIGIRELPSSFRQLCGLTKLRLFGCDDLVSLSDELCELESLKILDIRECYQLELLPENIGNLSKLEELHIFGTAIFQLPSSITRLSSLECLCWGNNPEGNNPEFDEEERRLKFVPSVSGLCSLKRLQLSDFNAIDEGLPSDLEYLVSLEYLCLRGSNFVDLPDFSQLPRLQYLDIKGCGQPKGFPETIREFEEQTDLPETARELEEQTDLPELPETARELEEQTDLPELPETTRELEEQTDLPELPETTRELEEQTDLPETTRELEEQTDLPETARELEEQPGLPELPETARQLEEQPGLPKLPGTTRELEEQPGLPKLSKTTRELYADFRFASRRNITKLLAECPELHAVAFCYDDNHPFMVPPEYFLARMCIRFPLPRVPRNTPFSVSYSLADDHTPFFFDNDDHTPDVGALRSFQYRCYQSNSISIDLIKRSWYCRRFAGFAVYFISSGFDMWGPHADKDIHCVQHCTVIAKLSHKNNRKALPTECVIANANDCTYGEIGHTCFAYIPFSSLCPESSVNPDDFSRFEVKFMNLEATADWGCSLLYYQSSKRLASPEDICSCTHTLASGEVICPECTIDDMGPFHKLEYMNLSGFKFMKFQNLTGFISRFRVIQFLDISGCARVRELPELAPTIRELYAPYNRCLDLENYIAELATKYSELYSVSFSFSMHVNDDIAFLKPEELAKKFIPITLPFLNRNTPFAVTYPFHTWSDDYNMGRCFKYPHNDSNKISISLDPTWYNHNFVGFVVCFRFPIKVSWESHPDIRPFRHCKLITKLTHKDNGSEHPLQTECLIGRLYDEEFDDGFDDTELVCFAYIPFSSLWPKSKAITDTTTPNHYLVFEAAFQELEFSNHFNAEDWEISTDWSCSLLYKDDKSLIEELQRKRENGSSESDSDEDEEEEEEEEEEEDEEEDEDEEEEENEEEEEKEEGSQHTKDNGGEEDNNPVVGHSAKSPININDDELELSEYDDSGEECESIDGDEDVEEYKSDAGHSSGPNRTKLWDIVDQVQCRIVSMPKCSDAKIARLLYTNSGVSILALSSDGIQKLWKLPNNEQNPTGKATANSIPQHWQPSGRLMVNEVDVNLEKVVPCIALSNDDSYIVSSVGGKVSLFNIMTFEIKETITSLPSASTFLAFDPHDDNIIVIGTEKSTIYIYDRIDKDLNELGEHQKPITGLAFSTELKLLVSSDADAQLCSWNTRLWKKKISVRVQLPTGEVCSGDTHVMFHIDQFHLLVTHETQLAIYDASKMELKNQWIPHGSFSAPISSATYSCNCQLIYASFKDGNIGVFDAHRWLRPRCRIAPSAYLSQAVLNRNEGVYAAVIAAHPQEPNQLAFGLTDGSVKVIEPLESEGEWGIKILNGKEGEDEKMGDEEGGHQWEQRKKARLDKGKAPLI